MLGIFPPTGRTLDDHTFQRVAFFKLYVIEVGIEMMHPLAITPALILSKEVLIILLDHNIGTS